MGRTLLILLLIGLLLIAVGLALHSKVFFWLGAVLVSVPLIALLVIVIGFAVLFIALVALAILAAMAVISGGAMLFAVAVALVIATPIIAIAALIGRPARKSRRVFVKRKG
jgi:hypothetical protein